MIHLEQIQRLEARINQAIELIHRLKGENESLRQTLDSAQEKVHKLEGLVGEFKTDQKEIEACIVRALQNLDRLEDEVATEPSQQPEHPSPKDADDAAEAQHSPEGNGELDIF
jgi:chemotaxis protein histidine kinase CheA